MPADIKDAQPDGFCSHGEGQELGLPAIFTPTRHFWDNMSFRAALAEEASDMLLVHDLRGVFVYVNKAAQQTLGYDADEIYGVHVSRVDHNTAKIKHVMAALKRHGSCLFTSIYTGKNQKEITVEVSSRMIMCGGTMVILSLARDISKRIKTNQRLKLKNSQLIATNNQLRMKSERDALTDLYNRLFFERSLSRMEGNRNYYPVSIFLIDIDGLKLVNDILGHSKGDLFLKKAVSIIKADFRGEDIVARLGGDEFAVLMPSTNYRVAEEKAGVLRRMALSSLGEPLPVSYSVGFATTDNIFKSLYDLVREADANMYREKESHREHTFSVLRQSLWQLRREGYHDF